MKKIHSFCCLLLLAVSFSSCNPNDDSNNNAGPNDDAFAQNFGSTVDRDFIGQVVDIDNAPIQGVTIKIGTSTVQTDVNGVFIINGANVYQKFAYITAKKVGFIDGSRAMVPTSGKNNVKIMLLPNAPLETIQSGVVSEVSIYSGTKVKFQGGFQDENGTNYTGPVQVSMFHLTPTDENISKLMPGMLYAQTSTNQEAVLETFGMLNVELRGSAGQKLNIKEGQTTEITMRIDDSQIATAPSSIPLWHFDEEKGYWKEDGVATKVGNKYVGEVSHFSWWNCDAFLSTVSLTVRILDSNGIPLSNVGVGLVLNNSNFTSYVLYTDNLGNVSGNIPINQVLTLNVYSFSECIDLPLSVINIGSFTSNTVLPDLVLNLNTGGNILSSTVHGTLLKCDNSNVTDGYVLLKYGNTQLVSSVINGSFSFNVNYCTLTTGFILKGVDFDNLVSTDAINYNFNSPITNIGNIQVCVTTGEFISYKIDSNEPIFYVNEIICNVVGNSFNFIGVGEMGAAEYGFYMTGNTITPGIYNTSVFSIDNYITGHIDSTIANSVQFNLSTFGAVGGYIDLTFNGIYTNLSGTHTITGVAHVIRDN